MVETDLRGVIDTHVHTSPDAVPRLMNDVEVAHAARDAGYRAIVLKSHHIITADRAQLVDELVEGIEVYGGLALNQHACGGLNAAAVEVAAKVGARIVWMPTFTSESHARHSRDHDTGPSARLGRAAGTGITVLNGAGRLTREAIEVIDVIAREDLTLATGHLSGPEIMRLVPEARERGVGRVVVTHPEMPCVGVEHSAQRELAALGGVWFERVYVMTLPPFGGSVRQVVEAVHAVGPASTVLATDLGQPENPSPVDGMRAYLEGMRGLGVAEDDLHLMSRETPARALGLDPSTSCG